MTIIYESVYVTTISTLSLEYILYMFMYIYINYMFMGDYLLSHTPY